MWRWLIVKDEKNPIIYDDDHDVSGLLEED
jgi:hypothetical protein